jgi:hypothetical protein
MARTRSTTSSAVNGRPLDFCLHRHPVSVNLLYHARMVLSVAGPFAYFARNARCTVTTDLFVWYSNTQNDFSSERPFFLCIHSHRLAAEMWTTMKSNLLVKKFLSCSFYLYGFCKYVSYGFPIINFCIPGVHYETSCILCYWQRKQTNIWQKLFPLCRMYALLASPEYLNVDSVKFGKKITGN